MDNIIPEYAAPTKARTARDRAGEMLHRLTWIIWFLSVAGFVTMCAIHPAHSMSPRAAWADAISDTLPYCSAAGAAIAVAGGALGNTWCWVVLILHVATFVLMPAMAYA